MTTHQFNTLVQMIAVLSDRVEEIANAQKNFVTKEDVKKFATKDDLKQYVTKNDLKEGLSNMAHTVFNGVAGPFETLEQRTDTHERRIGTLELSFWEVVKKKHARGEMTWLEIPHSISHKAPET